MAYKDSLSAEYVQFIRKRTMHFVKCEGAIGIFRKTPHYRKRNAKRKASVDKHIKKLLKYHKIAWSGYVMGELKKK